GQIAYQRQELPEAIELLERALELDREYDDAEALLTLSRAYLETGSTESALALLRRMTARADATGDLQQTARVSMLLAVAMGAVGADLEATGLLTRTEQSETSLVSMARQYADLAH